MESEREMSAVGGESLMTAIHEELPTCLARGGSGTKGSRFRPWPRDSLSKSCYYRLGIPYRVGVVTST